MKTTADLTFTTNDLRFRRWTCPAQGTTMCYVDHAIACMLSDLRIGRVAKARNQMRYLTTKQYWTAKD